MRVVERKIRVIAIWLFSNLLLCAFIQDSIKLFLKAALSDLLLFHKCKWFILLHLEILFRKSISNLLTSTIGQGSVELAWNCRRYNAEYCA